MRMHSIRVRTSLPWNNTPAVCTRAAFLSAIASLLARATREEFDQHDGDDICNSLGLLVENFATIVDPTKLTLDDPIRLAKRSGQKPDRPQPG